jgi:hypothetical protein
MSIRALCAQEFGDVAPAHVRRAAQRGFEIAIAPVDGSIGQRRIFRQHLFHRGQIKMTGDDESFTRAGSIADRAQENPARYQLIAATVPATEPMLAFGCARSTPRPQSTA